jgi:hypothetical protein
MAPSHRVDLYAVRFVRVDAALSAILSAAWLDGVHPLYDLTESPFMAKMMATQWAMRLAQGENPLIR